MSVMLHELIKLLHHSRVTRDVCIFRLGTSGGLGKTFHSTGSVERIKVGAGPIAVAKKWASLTCFQHAFTAYRMF